MNQQFRNASTDEVVRNLPAIVSVDDMLDFIEMYYMGDKI